MSALRHRARSSAVVALAISSLVAAGLSGCTSKAANKDEPSAKGSTQQQTKSPIVVATNLKKLSGVLVDKQLEVTATGGTFDSVVVSGSGAGKVPGKLASDHTSWVASGLLEPGTTYSIKTVSATASGETQHDVTRFTTAELSLDQQTWADVAPLDGETVGVGMPVIATFDVAVTNKASIERKMKVTSVPAQRGSWHWLSDSEAHWRPAHYWRAGTDVRVDLDINGVPAGGGIYGQESRHVKFHVGDAHVYKVSAQTHQMRVLENGKLLRTLPITTGKPGFTTRSGTKVIIEKYRSKRMNSETVGIAQGNPDYYDMDNVEYAMRVTYSGEFIHAAPWSVGDQGYANVSHGCTGMSTSNAAWLYGMTLRGDVVEYVGTDRPMTFDNGWGDWNMSYADYRAGSAL
jgi:lipoprotein-anchoring transpeptidase ErfK/SrfK